MYKKAVAYIEHKGKCNEKNKSCVDIVVFGLSFGGSNEAMD